MPRLSQSIAASCPDAVALLAPDRAPSSYADVARQIATAATHLRALGVRRNDRVALVLPDGPEALTAFLAVSEAAIAAPVNPALQQSEYEAHLAHVGATTLVTSLDPDSAPARAARALCLPIVRLIVDVEANAGVFSLEALTPVNAAADAGISDSADDVALLLTTSGTTSRPKVVPLTHAAISRSAAAIAASLQLTPSDRCFGVMPLFHVHGLIGGALASLAAGASVICPPGFDAPRFFAIFDELEPTWYTAVPTMHQAILARAPRHGALLDRRRLRLIRSCSAPLPASTREGLAQAFRAPVVEAYGMTEAAHQIASTPLPVNAAKAGSVGVATGTAIAILDVAASEPLAAGRTGEIVIQSPSLTAGYEGTSDANARAFVDGWFRTGDQGHLDDDGYLFITGRLKEIINCGGEKISPPEVDEALSAHAAVAQACSFALPDPRLGETVGAAVVLRPDAVCDERDLREFVARRLAPFKVPARIVFVAELPRTATGKVQRIGMAERLGLKAPSPVSAGSRPAIAAPVSARPTPLLHRLVKAIWCDVLDADDLRDDTTFFDAGGDSILAMQVLARVRDQLRVDVSVVALFENPTIAGLADVIARARTTPPPSAPASRTMRTTSTLSSAQQRVWFLHQWAPGDATYHDHAAWRVTGPLDRGAFERSLDAIVARHAILRTGFPETDGRPSAVTTDRCTIVVVHRTLASEPADTREATLQRLVTEEVSRPFDITRPPLVRGLTIELSPHEHVVVLTLHHLVCDGWSMAVLQREIGTVYAALRDRQAVDPGPLPMQYADYASLEDQWRQSAEHARQLSYWREHLAAPLPVLDLPTDRPRPAIRGFSAGTCRRTISPPRVARLRDAARAEGVTPFMLLLSAFATVLARYSRQDDLIVGTAIAGRTRADVEPLIGPFANTIALRVKFDGDPSFRDLLGRVRRETLDAYAYQRLPFDAIVDAIGVERRLDRPPLFQAFLNYRNLPARPAPFPGLLTRDYEVELPATVADVTLDVVDRGASGPDSGLDCRLDYDADLFDAEAMDRLLEQIELVLDDAVNDTTRLVADLRMMRAAEEQRVVTSWNETSRSFDRRCAHERVEAQARRTPDAIAVRCEEDAVTYRDLNGCANQLARRLVAAGAGAGTRVGIALRPSIDLIVAWLAVMKAGAAYVPLDPLQPARRLAAIHADTTPVAVITHSRDVDVTPYSASRVICVERDRGDIAAEPSDDLARPCSPDELFGIIHTSGSTGGPKGVVLSHRAVDNRLEWAGEALRLEADDRCLLSSSIAFDASITETFEALVAGASVVIAPCGLTDPSALIATITTQRVSVLSLVPSMLDVLVADPAFAACHSLRLIVVGGEALSTHLARATLAGLDVTIGNAYGPAETCVDVTWWFLNRHTLAELGDRPVPIGRPISNVRAYVLDAKRRPVPIGVPGELYIGGDCLADGYWQRPDLTEQAFVADPFGTTPGALMYRTGDLARHRHDGALLFLGRLDRQLKIRGVRVEAGEIEAALRAHHAVRDVAVIAATDTSRVIAYLVVAWPATAGAIPRDEWRRHLQDRVPAAMIPAAFVIVEAVPRTPGGKLDLRALPPPPALVATGVAAIGETPTQAAILEIWRDLLRTSAVGLDDDFFLFGGHSLLAMQVIARVRDRLGVTLSIRQLFEGPTVRQLSAAVASTGMHQPAPTPLGRVDRAAFRQSAARED
jgi:amino acid adenylation domain-containing protein